MKFAAPRRIGPVTVKAPLESRSRSLAKGATWRVVATLTTVAIAWLVTGEPSTALAIGGIEVVAKIVVYYLHERCWAHVRFGTRLGSLSASGQS